MQEAANDARPVPAGGGKWLLIGLLFLAPRVARVLYPYVWMEDPFYLYASHLIKHGAIPFRDFGHTQLPGAEYFLAFFYSLLGSSYRVAEVITQIVVYANAWLIFLVGKRLYNQTAGLWAGLLFSCSSLMFRYHVWEREVFILFFLTLAFYGLVCHPRLNAKRSILLGLLFAVGLSFKLTVAVSLGAVLLYVGLIRKQIASAAIIAASALIPTGLIFLCLSIVCPADFFNQALLHHFVKGINLTSRLEMLLFPTRVLDVSLAMGVLGVFFWKKRLFPHLWFPVLLAGVDWLFFSLLSPNVWPHNYVPSLLLLSLSGGVLAASLWEIAGVKRRAATVAGLAVMLCLMLMFVCPLKNLNWSAGSTYGFGYIPRKHIDDLSTFISDNTTREDVLLLPQYVASECDRRNVMSDRVEATGVFRWTERMRREGRGPMEIVRLNAGKTFLQVQEETLAEGWHSVGVLLEQRKVKFVVPDIVPGEAMPYSPAALGRYGYSPAAKFGPYVVWTPRR